MSEYRVLGDWWETAERYKGYWFHPGERPKDYTDEIVAFELLLSVGKFWRYSGSVALLDWLKNLPVMQRLRLINAACRQIIGFNELIGIIEVVKAKGFNVDDLDRLAGALCTCDNIDVVITVVRQMICDSIRSYVATDVFYAGAVEVEGELEDYLCNLEAANSCVGEALERRELIKAREGDMPRGGWWIDHLAYLVRRRNRADVSAGVNCFH